MKIISFIWEQVQHLFGSFNNAPEGMSKRALSAFAGITTAIYITCYKLEGAALLSALYSWQIFSAVCLGLITIPQLIEILNKKDANNINTTST